MTNMTSVDCKSAALSRVAAASRQYDTHWMSHAARQEYNDARASARLLGCSDVEIAKASHS